jgi:hypothetical protein
MRLCWVTLKSVTAQKSLLVLLFLSPFPIIALSQVFQLSQWAGPVVTTLPNQWFKPFNLFHYSN